MAYVYADCQEMVVWAIVECQPSKTIPCHSSIWTRVVRPTSAAPPLDRRQHGGSHAQRDAHCTVGGRLPQ
jgi:hypothetical protein